MKKILLFAAFLIFTVPLFSQLGINLGAQKMMAPEWEDALRNSYDLRENAKVFNPVIYAGLDYWFRLKNKRLEFLPELSFYQHHNSFILNDFTATGEMTDNYSTTFYGFFFNTNIYFLDFKGDCNCPTFSKDGEVLKKGLFLRIAPGVTMIDQKIARTFPPISSVSGYSARSQDVYPAIRAGLGIDIGITDFFTVTPMVQGTFLPGVAWNEIGTDPLSSEPASIKSNVIQIFAGLRLGFRFDELNKYGYR